MLPIPDSSSPVVDQHGDCYTDGDPVHSSITDYKAEHFPAHEKEQHEQQNVAAVVSATISRGKVPSTVDSEDGPDDPKQPKDNSDFHNVLL